MKFLFSKSLDRKFNKVFRRIVHLAAYKSKSAVTRAVRFCIRLKWKV